MRQLDKHLEVEVWPDVKEASRISCALLWKQPSDVLKSYPNLKAVFSLGAGVDHILQDDTIPALLPITHIVDPHMARDMTQYVITAALNHIRRSLYWQQLQQQGKWLKKPPFNYAEKSVGVMGLGFLGSSAAKAACALEIETVGWSRTPKTLPGVNCFAGDAELEDFLRATDIKVVITPHIAAVTTPETIVQQIYQNYCRLEQGKLLINTVDRELGC